LFLPPTLVGGLFGMNLESIPWSGMPGGFWFATLAALLSSAGTWLFLRFLDRS
jgi:Mg2+ and Co2+ transporter CorA